MLDATGPVSTTGVIGTHRKGGAGSCRGADVVGIHVYTHADRSSAMSLGEVRAALKSVVLQCSCAGVIPGVLILIYSREQLTCLVLCRTASTHPY